MIWQDLFAALALVLIIEGILPFLSPKSLRNTYQRITEMSDQNIRITGLICMLGGSFLLAWTR